MVKTVIVTPGDPATVVSTADLKKFLRLNTTAEDSLLDDFRNAVIDLFEKRTGVYLTSTTVRQWFNGFCSPMKLRRGPITSISNVKYMDENDSLQTLDAENYTADIINQPGSITFWNIPSMSETAKPVGYVEYVAGFASSPALIKRTICLMTAHFFEQRANYSPDDLKEIPMGFSDIVAQYRIGVINED